MTDPQDYQARKPPKSVWAQADLGDVKQVMLPMNLDGNEKPLL